MALQKKPNKRNDIIDYNSPKLRYENFLCKI